MGEKWISANKIALELTNTVICALNGHPNHQRNQTRKGKSNVNEKFVILLVVKALILSRFLLSKDI